MDIMSFNPDLNKQAQEVISSKKMTKLFTQFIWMANWISFIIFSEKCPTQCWEWMPLENHKQASTTFSHYNINNL